MLALFGIGFGAVHWSKSLMDGHDLVESRHPTRGSEETREKAVEVFHLGNKESGFTRRKLIRNTLIGALVVSPLPAVVLFRDLAPAGDPVDAPEAHAVGQGRPPDPRPGWHAHQGVGRHAGLGLPRHPRGPERAARAQARGEGEGRRPAHAAQARATCTSRPSREDWNYDGIVAYSKICTHVGCPVALYEQQTHHLLCPCHQSQFDITREAAVIFGPAKRPLPQLPITVDDEGYLVARSDFTEPVGPSFWERQL